MKITLFFLFFSLSCANQNIKNDQSIFTITIKPGEVRKVVLEKGVLKEGDEVFCKEKRIPWFTLKERTLFFVSESYSSDLTPFECTKKNNEGSKNIVRVILEEKQYPFERLSVPKEKIEFSAKDIERITKETELLTSVYNKAIGYLLFDGNFESPLENPITSQYGTKRIYNNKKNSEHLGIDFKANIGTPIKVSNSGKVVLAQDLFFTGNTVIIDHGLGVFTMYGHLSKINVQKDQTVQKNTLIGLSGNTGRVTGPHLHWGVKVQGNWVDGNSLILETKSL